MNTIKQLASILIFMLFTATYAMAGSTVPEKYNLDGQLNRVEFMSNTNFMDWESVDAQSLVVQTSPSTYYLVVLSSQAFNMPFVEYVGITGMNLMTRPGYDNIYVREPNRRWGRYIINRIYRLEDRQQVREIIAQLTGEKKIVPAEKQFSGKVFMARR